MVVDVMKQREWGDEENGSTLKAFGVQPASQPATRRKPSGA